MVFYNEVSYICNSDTSWNGEVDFFQSMLYVANYFAEKQIQKLSKNIKVFHEQKAKKKEKKNHCSELHSWHKHWKIISLCNELVNKVIF